MSRQMQHWLQKFRRQFFPIASQRFHDGPVSARIVVERISRKIDVAVQACGAAVIERVRQRNFGLDPIETEAFEWKRFEEWRTGRKRMNCRTNIVNKTWQRQFG